MNIDLLDRLDILEKRATRMRENPTPTEKQMAKLLTELKIEYIQQYVFGNYIADFYIPSKNVTIEVNGGYHQEESQKAYDARRMNYFIRSGIQVLNVRSNRISKSKDRILKFVFTPKGAKEIKRNEIKKAVATKKKITKCENKRKDKFTNNPPLQKVFRRKAEGKYATEGAFKNAYKSAIKKHIKYGIPILGNTQPQQ